MNQINSSLSNGDLIIEVITDAQHDNGYGLLDGDLHFTIEVPIVDASFSHAFGHESRIEMEDYILTEIVFFPIDQDGGSMREIELDPETVEKIMGIKELEAIVKNEFNKRIGECY